jgi:hypothetical protein
MIFQPSPTRSAIVRTFGAYPSKESDMTEKTVDELQARRAAVRTIARGIMARLDATQAPKGKRRDVAALELWIGACWGAMGAGDVALSEHLNRLAALVIAIRGADAIRDIAESTD